MNEEQYKVMLKLMIDKSNRPLTNFEKELLKQGIDQARSLDDFFAVAVMSLLMGRR